MNWKHKARAFRVLASMPFGTSAHYFLQRRVTHELPRSADTLRHIAATVERLLKAFREFGSTDVASATFFEFGAGRDLAISLALAGAGARRVLSFDVERLARLDLVRHVVRALGVLDGDAASAIQSWEHVLHCLRIDYHAPADARSTGLPDGSVDCVLSCDTLEHIPLDEARKILVEARRITRHDGLAIHLVDYTDHYARSDRRISKFNFLTYSDEEWSRYNSRLQYVNRLRHSDYMRLFQEAGWTVAHVDVEQAPVERDIADRLADRFRRYGASDLFKRRSLVVMRPMASAPLARMG